MSLAFWVTTVIRSPTAMPRAKLPGRMMSAGWSVNNGGSVTNSYATGNVSGASDVVDWWARR